MGAYRDAVLADSPVAYWRLAELLGTSAADETGNGHAGTHHGGVTLGAKGLLLSNADNPSADYDGTSGYTQVPHDSALNPGTGGFSIECIFKDDDTAAQQRVVLTKWNADGTTGWKFEIGAAYNDTSSDVHYVYMHRQNVNINRAVHSTTAVAADGNQHHVVITAASGQSATGIIIYVDGTAVALTTTTNVGVWPNVIPTADLFMGASNKVAHDQFFDGRLDEVALYTSALSAAQVTAHYNAYLTVAQPIPRVERAKGLWIPGKRAAFV